MKSCFMLFPWGKQLCGIRLTWTTLARGPCSGMWQAEERHGPVVKMGLVLAHRQPQGAAVVPLPLNWKGDLICFSCFKFQKETVQWPGELCWQGVWEEGVGGQVVASP